MKKRYSLPLVILAGWLVFSQSHAAELPPSPSTWTLPGKYLKRFPLGEVTDEELLLAYGAPRMTAVAGESIVWTYQESGEDSPAWSYVMREGVVVDVLYRAPGGRRDSALERQ